MEKGDTDDRVRELNPRGIRGRNIVTWAGDTGDYLQRWVIRIFRSRLGIRFWKS